MNNDRFKFRVWYPAAGQYCANFSLDTDGVVWSGHTTLREGFTLEFCTGLKDKTGRLIYEGDVLEYTFGIGKNSSKVQWFVAWVERYTSFRMVDVEGFNYLKSKNPGWSFEQYLEFNVYGFDTHSIVCRGYEVIGNIHEPKWGIESEVKK